ncbi:MAG: ADP-ribosylglycohydrolase family protein, partial [Chloroflexota bacterium]|nr:ADP-ribosylglycohydrolase family protein [Chloroflexota bacterium]
AGPDHERSQSNGSLMRILPVALTAIEPGVKLPELVERAHRASRVTHGHVTCQVVCGLYVVMARDLLRGDTDRARALSAALRRLRVYYGRHGPASASHLAALEALDGWPKRQGRGGAIDSFWSAWDAFAGADTYAETVKRAIAYGHDTDTTAAVAGALAGLYWGLDGIPLEWLEGMRGAAVVKPIIERLLAFHGWRTSAGSPLRLDRIDPASVPAAAGWTGSLGMTFLPGKRDGRATRGNLHWRDLAADATALRRSHDVDTLLLLVEAHELASLGVGGAVAALEAAGLEVLHHPVPDMAVPSDRATYREVLAGVTQRLRDGRSVAVACVGGMGRTGTAVACLLVAAGLEPEAAARATREARPGTIERQVQLDFVYGFARS